MNLEIEAKVKVDCLEPYIRRLNQLQAQPAEPVIQRDHFFDRPDHSLQNADCGLRLRTVSSSHTARNQLCFKGPKQPGPYKQRTEIEFDASDPHAARQFLEALGFQLNLVYEKRRTIYRLHDCQVCLDQVPRLGQFIEIEGPSQQSINHVINQLYLHDQQLIKTAYATLIRQLAQQQNLNPLTDLLLPKPPTR